MKTLARVVLAGMWLCVTLVAGLVLVFYTWFIESEIAYGIGNHSPLTLPLFVVATAAVWAAGPLLIWRFRRTRGWLAAAGLLGLLGIGTAIPKHAAERIQDDTRSFPAPDSWELELEDPTGYGAPLFGERDSATRVFTSPDLPPETCLQAREAIAEWGGSESVNERASGSGSVDICSFYVARDGTFVDVTVYDRAGWETHAAVVDYDVEPELSTQSFIRLTMTDST